MTSNGPPPAKVCRQRSVAKYMLAIFFMKSGFNTIIPLENGKTVTAKSYTNECLSNVLKQVEKHRRLIILHDNDNASAHKVAPTMNYLHAQRFQLTRHPAYAPNLSLCDFWLFPKIKERLRGKSSQDIYELHDAVQEQIDCLQKEDFYRSYGKWFERMNKCISVQVHDFEQI